MATHKNEYDIAIVGGGVIGLSIAWRLTHTNKKVVVVDAGSNKPPATFAAAGMLAPSFETMPTDGRAQALHGFGQRSLAAWDAFAQDLERESAQCIDYQRDGVIGVATTRDEQDAIALQAKALRSSGYAVHELTGAPLTQRDPSLGDRVIGAILTKGEGQVDPLRVHAALSDVVFRRADRRMGAVQKISPIDGVWRLSSDPDVSPGTAIDAAKVVIAGGVYAGPLLQQMGVDLTHAIRPVKGEALALQAGGDMSAMPLPAHVIRYRNVYICPKRDGRIIIGATEVEGRDDHTPDDAAIDDLRSRASALVPALAQCDEVGRWAGLRPGTIDNAPIMGAVGGAMAGIVLALGHFRNGILFAPATADLVMSILDRAYAGDPASGIDDAAMMTFDPARFL